MSFFEPLPPSPEPPRERVVTPEWFAPPRGVLAGIAVLELLLVRTAHAVAWVSSAAVYPTGLVFTVQVHVAPEANDALRDALMGLHGAGRRAQGADDDGWRFGVRFADGRKATTFGRHLADLHTRPESPVLLPRGGGAGSTEAHQELWLWPLPPPGPLTFACAWPALELPETLHDLDAGPIRAAANRAVTLWPETPTTPPAGGGWTSYP